MVIRNMGSNLVFLWFSFVYFCSFNVFIVRSEECKTLENAAKQCIVIQDCPELYSLLQKNPLPQDVFNRLRKVHCGFFNEQPKVWCPITATNQAQSQECQTPENVSGQCIVIQDCPALYSLIQKKPVAQDDVEYLRKAYCGMFRKQPKVCCPIMAENYTGLYDLLPSRAVCGKQEEERIIYGKHTTIREYPWMAFLEYEDPKNRGLRCGGSLINERYILTAAHCLLNLPPDSRLVSVRLGEHNLCTTRDCEDDTPGMEDCSDEPLSITIEEQIPHELYDPYAKHYHNDIALLRLSRAVVKFTSFIRPICLPLSEQLRNKYYIEKELTVAGWGRIKTGEQSNVKLQAKVSVLSRNDCVAAYESLGITLSSSQVCAGGIQAEDPCTGDSGGSLMAIDRTEEEENYIAYAVVSVGPSVCGIKGIPVIYTRVADYIEWIDDHMKP